MTGRVSRALRAVAIALVGLWAGVAGAQGPTEVPPPAVIEENLTRTLARMAEDDARLEQTISTVYGRDLSADKRRVAKAALRSILRNRRLPAYLTQLIAPVLTPTTSVEEGRSYVSEGMLALQMRGLRRLSTERKAQHIQLYVDAAGSLPAGTCKALFLGKLDTLTAKALERRYIASLTLGEFEAISAQHGEAMEAELAGYPHVRTINLTQAQGAERAYVAALRARLRRLPPGLIDRVDRNPEAADAAEVCLLNRQYIAAGLDLTEPYRGWWMTRLVEGME